MSDPKTPDAQIAAWDYDARSGSDAFLIRTGGTRTGETLRQRAMVRRLEIDPDAVALIHRFDHDDILTRAEAEHWDMHILPLGWWIVSDNRSRSHV